MKNCQKCNIELIPVKTNYGLLLLCENCFGHYYSEKNIELILNENTWRKIKNNSKISKSKIKCPKCKANMKLHKFSKEYNFVNIDICSICKILWLDLNEIEELKLNQKDYKLSLNKPSITESEINYILNDIKLNEKIKEAKEENRKVTDAFNTHEQEEHFDYSLNRVATPFNIITLITWLLRNK